MSVCEAIRTIAYKVRCSCLHRTVAAQQFGRHQGSLLQGRLQCALRRGMAHPLRLMCCTWPPASDPASGAHRLVRRHRLRQLVRR